MTDHRAGVALAICAILLLFAGPLVGWIRQQRHTNPRDVGYVVRYRGEKRQ